MASDELRRLWNLAQIDTAILEIRKRASSMDAGQKIQKELEAAEAVHAELDAQYHGLSAELKDLELQQKSAEDKIQKFNKQLYGGGLMSPREVENIGKEIEALKKQRDRSDERVMELFDLVPPSKKAVDEAARVVAEKKVALAERRKAAVRDKELLEAKFKQYTAVRPSKVSGISPALLARYDAIRQKHGGIGMVQALKTAHCGGCGTHLPEKTMIGLHDDKVVTCEACHRLLYYTEGLV